MVKVAILIDLELGLKSGGHVKFWENIYLSLKNKSTVNLTFFFLGKKSKFYISDKILIKTNKPIISSRILRVIGVDADHTDLFFFNPWLFFELKKFDLIHTTDQLYCMSNTARLASKFWRVPLTTSYHTDAPSYSNYYVTKFFGYFPKFFRYLLIEKLKIPYRLEKRIKYKIRNYFKYCRYAMVNENVRLNDLKIQNAGECVFKDFSRGINTKVFEKKKVEKSQILKKYKILANGKIVFFCGRIHELKGAVFLSQIHKILNKERKINVTTILAGEDIHGKKCKSIAGENFYTIGHISQKDISQFYNLCDLFVLPSLYETGPQVVLEAKACNAVCVVSPLGGGKRIKKNGFDGIIVKDYDIDSWVNTLSKLLCDSNTIKKIKSNLKKSYNPISWEKVFKKFFLKNWNTIIKKND